MKTEHAGMTYETFSEFWDETFSKPISGPFLMKDEGMSDETMQVLIEYGEGNTTKIDEIIEFLKHNDE
jgi:hypothetical protein